MPWPLCNNNIPVLRPQTPMVLTLTAIRGHSFNNLLSVLRTSRQNYALAHKYFYWKLTLLALVNPNFHLFRSISSLFRESILCQVGHFKFFHQIHLQKMKKTHENLTLIEDKRSKVNIKVKKSFAFLYPKI